MSHQTSEEGISFWLKLRQLLDFPQISDILIDWDPSFNRAVESKQQNLFSLVSQVKVKFNYRFPLQIEHVAIDFVVIKGFLCVEILIITEIPCAEKLGKFFDVPLVAKVQGLEIV